MYSLRSRVQKMDEIAKRSALVCAGARRISGNHFSTKECAMRTTKILPIAALVLTAIFVPTAPGGAPMGPPLAWLGEGQWSIGAEYGYENMDMEAFGTATETIPGQSDFTYAQPFTLDGFSSTMFFGI